MKYQIDKGVPVPKSNERYPLQAMEVGDSFEFPIQFRRTVQTLAWMSKKKSGRVYKVKKENNEIGRIWRIE